MASTFDLDHTYLLQKEYDHLIRIRPIDEGSYFFDAIEVPRNLFFYFCLEGVVLPNLTLEVGDRKLLALTKIGFTASHTFLSRRSAKWKLNIYYSSFIPGVVIQDPAQNMRKSIGTHVGSNSQQSLVIVDVQSDGRARDSPKS
ncbi:conserved hypothetical protein [Ricinus communis]|uniref:Uncharacterized protein n=1 Tax=Ricinus communis TaxID=3988 RepID=B9T0G5_RICCO|nr:conserved hypothetical protein [Ricinus communis]